MAKSGSKSVTVTNYDTLKFSWEEASQDITNNKTIINWKLQLIATSYGLISSTVSKDWSVTVNGTKYSGTNKIGIDNNETKTLASGSTTIAHNSDGTKTFSYSFSQEIAITFHGEYVGTKSGSGTGTLDTIPRKSTLAVENGTLGTEQTLKVTRQSDDFTHTIVATCGGQSKTICEKSSSTSIKFTPPLNWASENTTGTSVSVAYKITTYNGSTSVGSNSYTNSCSIPSSVKPTVSFTVEDSEGYAGTFGNYVQTLSKAKVVIDASGSYGSTIKSYSTTVDGKTYTSASFTTSVLSGTGTLTIKVTVTDSRGRTATASKTIEVLAYAVPKITEVTLNRCNSDGKSNASGEYMAVVFTTSVTSLNSKNTAKYSVQYKKSTESDYAEETITKYSNQYSVTGGVFVFKAETSSSYDVIFAVEDQFTRKHKTLSGSSIRKLLSFLKVGFGVAIGKIAELAGFLDIGITTIFRENIYMGHYHDNEKNIYFKNNASETGKTYANDGIYPHNCKIYSGSGTSPYGIGLYDTNKSIKILAYNDYENYLFTETVLKHQIAVGYPSETLTLSSTEWTKIPLDTINPSDLKGPYLELSDGGIKCKKAGFVKFSCQCYVTELTAYDTIGIGIQKSSSSSMSSWFYRKQNHTTMYNAVTDFVADVKEGDIIYLMVRNSTAARGIIASGRSSTRMVVEYVG